MTIIYSSTYSIRYCETSRRLICIFYTEFFISPEHHYKAHHISDHFMNFCIVESKTKKKPIPTKYIEVENVNPKSVANFKNCVVKSELISSFDNNPLCRSKP